MRLRPTVHELSVARLVSFDLLNMLVLCATAGRWRTAAPPDASARAA
jgi:hypothetical protein